MPVLSATYIKKHTATRKCDSCDMPLSDAVGLFGMADIGDPPYTLYICVPCAHQSDDPDGKIAKALTNAPKRCEQKLLGFPCTYPQGHEESHDCGGEFQWQ